MLRNKYNKLGYKWIVTSIVLVACGFAPCIFAMPNIHDNSSGPYEIVIKMGHEGDGLILPLKISDQNKPEKLNVSFSVPETALKIKLEEYVPDLVWETTAVEYDGDGIAAKLKIKGNDFEQDVWLSSANLAKQSITSSIGGVTLKKLNNSLSLKTIVKELTNPKVVGVISVWLKDTDVPFEYAVKVNDEINIPGTDYKLRISEYMPHYSIEVAANKVVNLSEEPVNPAIKVAFNDGKTIEEQWIWSKFQSAPHQENKFPLRIQFADFDSGKVEGRYFLVVANEVLPWLLFSDKGKRKTEEAVIGQSFNFTNKDYFFIIEKIVNRAIVETKWKNNSEQLVNPALITTIEQDGDDKQAILELNKPLHYKTDIGTLVMLFRHSP